MAGVFCRAAAVFATTFGAAWNNILCRNPYEDVLAEFNLTPESSDDAIRQALVAVQEEYSKSCPAGSVLVVTRNNDYGQRRIIVAQGEKKACDADTPVTEDSLFEIASISKPFTGLLLALQIAEGVLTLDTPLNDLLPSDIPDLRINGNFITLGQVVTHTAGFLRDTQEYGYKWEDGTEEDMLQAIRNAARKGLDQTGAFSYSNFGLAVLGYALGRVTGISFPELQKGMTDELEMGNTWIETLPEETRTEHLAQGYFGPCRADYHFEDGIFLNGAGNTLSSGNDLSRFLEAIMAADSSTSSDPLQQALRLSTTPLHFETGTSGIAYSWFFDQYGSAEGTIYEHTGSLDGFHSTAIFQPSTQTAIVGLSNCCGTWIGSGVSLWSAGEALASKLLQISSDGETGKIFKQMREQESASISMLFSTAPSLEY